MKKKYLFLDENKMVSRGRNRECYFHPQNNELCIKVNSIKTNSFYNKNKDEYKFYKNIRKKGIDTNRISSCISWVETNKGCGLVFELIKDNDGKICRNLNYHIYNKIITNKEIQFELLCLKGWMIENFVNFCELNPDNIFYKPDNRPGHRLILVSGLFDRCFFKILNFSKYIARARVRRNWKIFEKKYLNEKIGRCDFEWFFNTNVNINTDFFMFLNRHVGTRLMEGLSSRHHLEYHDYNDKSYVFKRFSPSDNSDISRKLDLTLKSYILSGAQRSFRGAFWLQKAEIPSINPVAWAVIGKGYRQVSYFIYEKIDCTGSIQDALRCEDISINTRMILLFKMGQITRKIHEERLRHTDIVAHNFLYKKNGDFYETYIIDTDKMQKANLVIFKKIKLFFDLRCLRRLKLNKEQTIIFFNSYFNGKLSEYQLKLWKFWLSGGFSLPRRFKKRKDEKIKELMKMSFFN